TNYRTAVAQTAAELATTMGTSEATVIRLARELGYDGFPGLRRHLHEMVRADFTSLDLLERERTSRGTNDDTLAEVAHAEIEHLRRRHHRLRGVAGRQARRSHPRRRGGARLVRRLARSAAGAHLRAARRVRAPRAPPDGGYAAALRADLRAAADLPYGAAERM